MKKKRSSQTGLVITFLRSLPPSIPHLHTYFSNHGDYVCLQWLVGNVVGRDDTLYARMKQRDLDGHDSIWEPIFVDDGAIGLGEQKNKVIPNFKL